MHQPRRPYGRIRVRRLGQAWSEWFVYVEQDLPKHRVMVERRFTELIRVQGQGNLSKENVGGGSDQA